MPIKAKRIAYTGAAARAHVKKGDSVVVIAGKDRGKKGKVLRVFPGEGKLLVEGINIVKKHQRPNQKIMQGGVIDKEAPVDRSKVMLVCPRCQKPSRTGRLLLSDGRAVRKCKRCGEVVDR